MIKTLAKQVIAFRFVVMAASLVLLGAAGVGIKNLYFEGSTDIWFLKDDPVLLEYEELKEIFENNEFLIIGLEATPAAGTFLNQPTLQAIGAITAFLEAHVAVTKVSSVSKYELIHSEDDVLRVDPIIPEEVENFALSTQQWQTLDETLRRETIVHGLLFTPDLKHTLITARVIEQTDYTGDGNAKAALFEEFTDFLAENGLEDSPYYRLYPSGSAVISTSYLHNSIADQSVIYPLVLTLILVFLYALFRHWSGLVLPTLVILASVTATLGVVGHMGWPMNVLNVAMPTIITVIALADSIHILVGFYRLRNEGLAPRDAARAAIERYFTPCLLTTVTTAAGFLALSVSRLAPVSELGLAMPVGVVMAFGYSVFFLPATLSFIHGKPERTRRFVETSLIASGLRWLSQAVIANSRAIVAVFALLLVPVLVLCALIKVDTNFVRNFKEDSTVRQGLDYFDDTFKGALSLEFVVDSGAEEGVKDPAFLRRVLAFQEYVTGLEGCGRANSMVNYLRKINQVLHNDDPAYYAIPDSRTAVAQFLFMYLSSGPDEDLADLMSFDSRYLRISVFFEVAPSSVTKARVAEIERLIEAEFGDLNITTTGRAVLFNRMDVYVLDGLVNSFSLALGIIALCFLVVLRSVRFGALVLIPNLLPILFAGAVMGAFGIFLDFSTLMIAAVTLGIAVDDTIHVCIHYIHARDRGETNRDAIRSAIETTGAALVTTSIILIAGFSMLTLSSFVPTIYTGILGGVVIVGALFADLVLLPAGMVQLETMLNRTFAAPSVNKA